MTSLEANKKIINTVLRMLPERDTPTSEKIRLTVQLAIEMLRVADPLSGVECIEENQLIREIEALCNVSVPDISVLDDQRGHQAWLSARRAEIQWRFWGRYNRYLENNSDLPPKAIRRLDDITDQILSRLEDPLRPSPWDRRGMVVGQVQSGKTSNYTALICKAVDAGYKLIIVLAGIHNSLRSQTQLRLDEGFLGFDTQRRRMFDPNNTRLGVGLLRGAELYLVHSLTYSAEKGDFNLAGARQANVMIGGDPVLLVVKKNASVLKNLQKWAVTLPSSNHRIPLLLIDDEADNASINTNPILDEDDNPDPEMDPSKINGLIRKLLNSFEQSAYIGYTATPFANIFIADNVANNKYGEDLFPRSFIINLQPPSNYFGPAKLFGLTTDPITGQETASGLPLIRHIHDYLDWIPDKHKKDHQPGPLPQSVKQAIRAFILTCAVRHARGQVRVHNSMLIHVTRFTAVQSYVTEQVKDELSFLQQRLRYGDGGAPEKILEELKALWDIDFEPTMHKFCEPDLVPVKWDQVKAALYMAASKIEIRKINGTARDTLQYVEHKDGLSVICIGGDKLSRGLTLSGLSISYYLRASKMYDTLMQMGRWFGYRTGYTDLCRLYTTSALDRWYRDITSADEELRQMLEDMAVQEKTPEDYGLGVKKHPDGLLITAAVKMRNGQTVMLSYTEKIKETIVFFKDPTINQDNLFATEQLIRDIDARYTQQYDKGNYIWHGVDGNAIVDFLTDYSTHETARTVQSAILAKYVRARIEDHELVDWTVALISKQENVKNGIICTVAGLDIGLTERTPQSDDDASDLTYRIGRLVNPSDEWIDLSQEEWNQAKEATRSRWEQEATRSRRTEPPDVPSGLMIRRTRPAQRGLLLLYILKPEATSLSNRALVGFAISFPKSSANESSVEYVVNTVWQQELRG